MPTSRRAGGVQAASPKGPSGPRGAWTPPSTGTESFIAGRSPFMPLSTVVSSRTDGHRVTDRFTPEDLATLALSRCLSRRTFQHRSMRHVAIQHARELRLVVGVDA